MFYNTLNIFNYIKMGEYVVSPILLELTPDTGTTFTATVVIAGISIVVGILLLLILVFSIFGKIAPVIDKRSKAREEKKAVKKAAKQAKKLEKKKAKEAKKNPKNAPEQSVKDTAPVKSTTPAPSKPAAPVVEQGVSGEVVAAITAAIVASEGPNVTVRSIKKKNVAGRNPWAQAANIDNTRPF